MVRSVIPHVHGINCSPSLLFCHCDETLAKSYLMRKGFHLQVPRYSLSLRKVRERTQREEENMEESCSQACFQAHINDPSLYSKTNCPELSLPRVLQTILDQLTIKKMSNRWTNKASMRDTLFFQLWFTLSRYVKLTMNISHYTT